MTSEAASNIYAQAKKHSSCSQADAEKQSPDICMTLHPCATTLSHIPHGTGMSSSMPLT